MSKLQEELPCLMFAESEADDECKHCGWTECAHDGANAVRASAPVSQREALEDVTVAAKALLKECWRYEGECAVCTTTWDSEHQVMEHEDGCFAEALYRALKGSPSSPPSPETKT